MENFVVSARKYRPDAFDSVVGQKNIGATLKNAIKNNHLAHAYLFCGPRGVGKTTSARIFAKTINCSNISDNYEACNECESCLAFAENRSYNIHELDAASNNSVEDIRTLIDKVRIPPQIGSHSVYIIDEVHMLSSQAFNAFLKTLEEPPPHARFILATTEKHKILPTILSRCQIFDFNRIKVEDAVKHLAYVAEKEGITVEMDALNIIAQKADGAMRDALSFFDQIVSFAGDNISYQDAIDNLNVLDYDYYFKLTDAFLANDISKSLLIFDEILGKGFDGHHFITGMAAHFRDILVCKDQATIQLLEVGDGIKLKYKEQSAVADMQFLLRALNIANQADLDYRGSSNKRLQAELAIMKITELMRPKAEVQVPVQATTQTNTATTTTAPVSKTPVVQEISTPATPTANPIVKEVAKPVVNTDPPASSRRNVRTSMSMKNLKNSVPVKEEVSDSSEKKIEKIVNVTAENPVSQEQVEVSWAKFSEFLNKTPRLYHAVKALKPALNGTEITISLANELLLEKLDKMKPKILSYLKGELQNKNITLNMLISDEVESKRLYTDSDKFQHLNDINNNLYKLKDKFNLDFK